MDQILNEATVKAADEILKDKLKKLTDNWLSGEIDNASYAVSVAGYDLLNQLEEKLLGYQEYAKLTGHMELIIGLVSGKHLTPKEEQQVKDKLREIQRIRNNKEDSGVEREQAVDGIADKIEGLLLEILELVKG